MNTSEVLNKAADLIEERGWGQGPASMLGQSGICAMGAIGLAMTGRLTDDYMAVHECPAGQAVFRYLGDRPGLLSGADRIWSWNDDSNTASEVIEVLRATAVIEAAREQSSTPDLTPLHDAALPKDAPGAWIREAIEAMAEVSA